MAVRDSAAMERQRDYVLRSVEERGVRLVRLWFTDVLGQLKCFAISPAELENALEEGMTFDGSAIDGFSRVQESDVLARPDANSFELLPWADPAGARGADLLRHLQPRRHPVRGRPPPGAAAQPRPGAGPRLHVLRRPGDGVLLLHRRRRRPPDAARHRLVLRPHHGRRGRVAAQAHDPDAGGDGHPGRVLVPRGLAEPARDRPPPHRRPVDGRQRDDVPAGRAGSGDRRRGFTPRSCPSRSRACRARGCTPT